MVLACRLTGPPLQAARQRIFWSWNPTSSGYGPCHCRNHRVWVRVQFVPTVSLRKTDLMLRDPHRVPCCEFVWARARRFTEALVPFPWTALACSDSSTALRFSNAMLSKTPQIHRLHGRLLCPDLRWLLQWANQFSSCMHGSNICTHTASTAHIGNISGSSCIVTACDPACASRSAYTYKYLMD